MDTQMPIRKLTKATVTLLSLLLSQLSFAIPGDIAPISDTNPANHTLTINNVTGDGRVPTTPQGITYYDGLLWVVDFATDRIYRVYPNDILDTDEITVLFSAGDSDLNIPLSDANDPPINSDGTPIGSCASATPAGQYCGGGGITFAENFLWNASPITDDIIKVDPVDGDNLETENALASLAFPSPTDMAFDGSFFWVVDWQSNTINKVLPEDGTIVSSIPGPSTLPTFQSNPSVTNARPFGIAWDGQALWVSEQSDLRIYRINPSDGSILAFFDTQGSDPKGLTWDGEYLWHIDQTTQTIYKLDSGVIPFGIEGCFLKNGIGIADSDVLLSQTAVSDQTVTTNSDGCFAFPNFVSGSPVQVQVSETGVNQKPVITLIGSDVMLLVGDVYSEPGYTAIDTEDGDISAAVIATPDVINNPNLIDTSAPNATGVIVSYDVIDTAGNNADTVYRTVRVQVVDTTVPEITLIGDNPLAVEQGSIFSDPGAIAIDDRDGDISASIEVTGSVDSNTSGLYTLTYNVTDATGNAAVTVTRTVSVSDTTIPVITLTGSNTVTLEKGDVYSDAGATAADNIDGDITASISTTGSVTSGTVGSYILTYNVSDASGNAAITVSRTITVVDTTVPVITLIGGTPYNQELNTVFTDPGATALDAPSEDLTSSITIVGSVNTSLAGTYTLTYNVTDTEGNAAVSVIRDVVVADTGAPTITILGDNPLAQELGSAFTDPGATASDAIDGDISLNIVIAGDSVNTALSGTYNITYNVVDSVGNAAPTETRTVTVGDTTPPLITLTGSTTVLHELQTSYVDAGATASDNTDGDITANIVVGGDTVNINTIGVYSITYNVNDAAGNSAAPITRIVDVADRTAPVITLLGITPLDHEVGTVFVDPGATAADVIDGNVTANIGVTGTVDPNTIGAYTLSYNVSDSAGNTATTVTRIVNVVDTGAPTIVLIGDNPILHELQTVFTDPGATASDAADGDVTSSIIATGTVDSNTAGTYVLSYNVADSQSNAATTVTRNVIVADRTAPLITLTGNAAVNAEQGTTYTDAGATASDIIDGDISLNIIVTGTVDANTAGTYTLNYNIADAAGNAAAQVSRTVTVLDTTIPVITLTGANPLNHEVGTVFIDPGATASDNIDGVITASIGVSGTVDANTIGTYSLTYNAPDSSNNAATTVTRTVNVVDTGAPSIALIGDDPILHELQTVFTDPGATASDASDGDVTSSIVATGTVDSNTAGTYILSYNVTDSQSNPATTVTRNVIVADRTAPVITLTGGAAVNAEQGATYTDAGATASDIIDGDISLNIAVTGTVDANTAGTYTLNYNISDAAGNAAVQISRTVTVLDTTIPVITLTGANPLNHEVGTVFIDPGATASDNIDGVITANIGVSGTVDANTIGAYSLTYNASDSSNNAATTVTRTVNVVDTGAPSITLIGNNPILHELQAAFTDPGATASDAADGDVTANIIVTGTVNVNAAATYTLSYNVVDSQSNSATTVTRDIIVADRTAPVITLSGSATVNVEQGSVYTDAGASAADTIDGDVSANIVVGGSVNANVGGTYILTYNVSDAAGNTANQLTRTVVVSDTTLPVITLTGADPLNHEVGTIFTDPGASAADNIDADISANIGVTGTVNANIVGAYILSYNVSDAAGNNATTVTRTVNVADTGAPTINMTGANPLNHEINTTYTDSGATASDVVDDDATLTAAIVTVNNVNANVAGSYTITYNVTDSGGNPAAQQTRTVNVADFTAPVITLLGNSTVNIELGSSYTDAGATATDNVDGTLDSSIVTSGSVNSLAAGTYVISYDVSDAAGNNAAQITRTVVVSDTTAPVITLLGSTTVNHEQGTAYSDAGASATDNTDGNITANITVSGFVDANASGTYILSYNVSDAASNNAVTVTRTINVTDTTIPVLSLVGADPLNHEQGTPYADPGATASDSVDGDITANIVMTGTVNSNAGGSYTLTYNVSDAANNAATTITRNVIVADTTVPTITLTGNSTINHEQGTAYTDAGASGFDSVDGDLTASINVTGSVNVNVGGTYTLTYNLSDAAGNTAITVTRDVIVADTIIPAIILTGNAIVNHEQGVAYADAGASAADNLDGDISANIVITGFVDVNLPGTYTLSYNVNDAAGNAATTVTRDIVIADTTIPVITLSGNASAAVEQGSSYTDAGATATDNVDGNLTASIVVSGDTVNVNIAGVYVIRYDVSDAATNSATQVTRTVTVADTTLPVITLAGSAIVSQPQGATYTDAGSTASDTVDGDISVNVVMTGSVDINTIGSYVLSYNVSDAAGNAATTVTRTVTITDGIAPVITLAGNAIVNHEQGVAYSDAGATASDNLDGDISGSIILTGSVNINAPGTYTLSYNINDAAGNAATTVTRDVIIADTTVPVITLTGNASVTVEQGTSYTDAGATASDNVDGNLNANVIQSGDTVNVNTAGIYTIRYDVSDAAGNTAIQVIRSVTVSDTIAPVITLLGSTPSNHQQGSVYTDAGVTASDSVDGNITANVVLTGTVDANTAGTYTLTYNVSDAAGNAGITVTRDVIVADTEAPIITLSGSASINHEQGAIYTDAGATASDSLDGDRTASITTTNNVIANAAGIYTVDYNVADVAGNIATTVTRTVTVADTTIPVITLSGDSTLDHVNGQIFVDPGYIASDNIDGDVATNVVTSGALDVNTDGTYVLSYDVVDSAGNNATTLTRTVNVVTPTSISIEAETATIGGAHAVSTTNIGFTGTGYIEHSGEGYIEYTFTSHAVAYNLTVRYALDTGDRPLEVLLNSTSLGNVAFPATGSLTTWLNTATFAITPLSGSNTIRLSTTGSSGANVDSLTLTPQ